MEAIIMKLRQACSLLILAGMAAAVSAQPNFDDVEIRSMHVNGNVWMIYGGGLGNVTVQIGDQGVLVVDTQVAATAPKILEEIRRLAGPDRVIRYVINTHQHGDHTGGNEIISAAGATIVAGNEAGDVTNRNARVIAHENVMLGMATSETPVDFELWPQEVYIGESYTLHFNGEAIELLYQGNSHTNGDTMVFFRSSNVISTGDVYVTTSYPFIDINNGGHINGLIDSLNQVIRVTVPEDKQEGGTMVIPGHGRLSDEADVVDYRDMMTIIRDRVQYMIDQGMTLNQVLAAGPSMDYDGRYSRGFVTAEGLVTAIYNSLSE